MSSILSSNSYSISKRAFEATFQNESDPGKISTLFATKFKQLYASSIKKYISTCIGLPVGGPITPGPPVSLASDLYNTGYESFKATFSGYDDINKIANLFASVFQTLSTTISLYMSQCTTIPAAPPTIPLSPGGPIIIAPDATMVSDFQKISESAFFATFMGYADEKQLAKKFSSEFKTIGTETSLYVSRCKSLPGGGLLVPS